MEVKLPVSPSAPLTLFDAMHLITDIGYHTQFYAEDQAQTLMHARQAVCQLGYTPSQDSLIENLSARGSLDKKPQKFHAKMLTRTQVENKENKCK